MLPHSIDHHAIRQEANASNPRSRAKRAAAPSRARAWPYIYPGTWAPRPSGPSAPRSRSAPRRTCELFLGRLIASRSRRSASIFCWRRCPRRSRRLFPRAGRRRLQQYWAARRAAARIGTGSCSSLWPAATAYEDTRHCIGALRPRGGGSITPSVRSTRRLPGQLSPAARSYLG